MHKKMLVFASLSFVAIMILALIPSGNSAVNNSGKDGPGEGIQFMESNWSKVLTKAKSENKLIFLDAYASWCGPCKLLKKKTFTDKEAGEFFNQHFINAAIDMEKGEGPALAKKYGVNAYPTLIIVDADGNIITYTKGYIKPKQLIEFGKNGLSLRKK